MLFASLGQYEEMKKSKKSLKIEKQKVSHFVVAKQVIAIVIIYIGNSSKVTEFYF